MPTPYDLTPAEIGLLRASNAGDYDATTLPAATGVPLGTTIRRTDLGFSRWHAKVDLDGITRWAPIAPTKLIESGTLVTGALQTAEQLLKSALVLKGTLGRRPFRVVAVYGKSGTTDASANSQLRLGTTNDLAGASLMNITTLLAAANRGVMVERWFRLSSATALQRLGSQTASTSGQMWSVGPAAIPTNVTIPDADANDLWLVMSTAMAAATADSPQAEYFCLETMP